MLTEQAVKDALKQVIDPEIHLDIVSLGLIYDIKIAKGIVNIKMTLTTPMCPYGPQLLGDAEEAVSHLEGVKGVKIELVFEPQWQPPDEVKMMLGIG